MFMFDDDTDDIERVIEILNRVKNCNYILNDLKKIKENLAFKNYPNIEKSWLDYIHRTICECIEIIEKGEGLK